MTGEIAKQLGAEVIRHKNNLGYGAALKSLFRRAIEMHIQVAVTMDADGQHDPRSIPRLVEILNSENVDIVMGSRFLVKGGDYQIPRIRRAGIQSINRLARRVSGAQVSDSQCGMRAYRVDILPSILPTELGMGASTEIVLRANRSGLRFAEVQIPVKYFESTSSTHNPLSHGIGVVGSTLKQYSFKHPLIFYGLPSIIFFLIAIGFGLWTTNIFLSEHRLVTNLTLVTVGSAIIGLILGLAAVLLYTISSILREERQTRFSE
jgi:glycosyltransferase involved in cell wall biosynthesis